MSILELANKVKATLVAETAGVPKGFKGEIGDYITSEHGPARVIGSSKDGQQVKAIVKDKATGQVIAILRNVDKANADLYPANDQTRLRNGAGPRTINTRLMRGEAASIEEAAKKPNMGWWNGLTAQAQKKYLQKHPDSIYAKISKDAFRDRLGPNEAEKAEVDKLIGDFEKDDIDTLLNKQKTLDKIIDDPKRSKQQRKYAEDAWDDLDDAIGEIEDYEDGGEEEYASAEETAAPLSKEKYDWYKYVGARGTKVTNSRGNRTVVLKNGSMFGVRPATSKNGKTRLITEELGPTIVFSFEQDAAQKIINKGTRIPVKVTFKRPEAPAVVKKVTKAAKKAANISPSGKNLGTDQEKAQKEAKAVYINLVAKPLGATNFSKETISWLKTASKQAAKIDSAILENKNYDLLIKKVLPTKLPRTKTKRVDKGNGNLKVADAMQAFIPKIAKKWQKDITNWEDLELTLSDLADYVKLYVALCSGNENAIYKASYFDTNIREQLPKSVWNWLGQQGRFGY